ncbi:hypothetical protein GF373_17605 [bacterium]|nr:hypothetical protein [bacterium]
MMNKDWPEIEVIEKARQDDPEDSAALSVQDRADPDEARRSSPVVFYIADRGDDMKPIGIDNWPKRDEQLAEFWPTEPLLAGAIYSLQAKIAALEWSIEGPSKTVAYYQSLLQNAGFGGGWSTFALKWMNDLLTCDNGAFIEILRPRGAGPRSRVSGIAHLDSQRCERTGDPEVPVLYHSKRDNKLHPLHWWQVVVTSDMPSAREEERESGICAVSRALRAAQILRDIAIFKRQKVGGKRVPGIIFAQGIRRGVVQQAVEEALEQQRQEGLSHFTNPIVIAAHDPGQNLNVDLIELAGLPDGYDEDVTLQWYVAQLAIDFGVDYGEFAPLPGKGLGTASQVESMEERARGKGPRIVARLLEHAINYYVLPESTNFNLMTPDPGQERLDMDLSKTRAEERAIRIQSGEITVDEARELAALHGDLPREHLGQEQHITEGRPSSREDVEIVGNQ